MQTLFEVTCERGNMKQNIKFNIIFGLIVTNLAACAQLQQKNDSNEDVGAWEVPAQVNVWLPQAEANVAIGYKTFSTGDYMVRCSPETKEQCRHIYEWIQVRDFAVDEIYRFSIVTAPHQSEKFLCASLRRSIVKTDQSIEYTPAKDGKVYSAVATTAAETVGSESDCLAMVEKTSYYISSEAEIRFSDTEVFKEHLILRDIYPQKDEARPFWDGFTVKFPMLAVWIN